VGLGYDFEIAVQPSALTERDRKAFAAQKMVEAGGVGILSLTDGYTEISARLPLAIIDGDVVSPNRISGPKSNFRLRR
jgi:hypothetical protein